MVSPRHDAVDPMPLPSGNSINALKIFCICSLLCSHLNALTMFPPVWDMLRRFRYVQSFLLKRLDGNIGRKDKKSFSSSV